MWRIPTGPSRIDGTPVAIEQEAMPCDRPAIDTLIFCNPRMPDLAICAECVVSQWDQGALG